jgi:hypothetical protein
LVEVGVNLHTGVEVFPGPYSRECSMDVALSEFIWKASLRYLVFIILLSVYIEWRVRPDCYFFKVFFLLIFLWERRRVCSCRLLQCCFFFSLVFNKIVLWYSVLAVDSDSVSDWIVLSCVVAFYLHLLISENLLINVFQFHYAFKANLVGVTLLHNPVWFLAAIFLLSVVGLQLFIYCSWGHSFRLGWIVTAHVLQHFINIIEKDSNWKWLCLL